MCGIFATAGFNLNSNDIDRALRSLHHRGPDGLDFFKSEAHSLVLAHTRLSIIDIESGFQPLYSKDRTKILICNGEIYGYEALRDELINQGYLFSTGSDSEVILHLYERDGLAFTKFLRGEFSFVLYDSNNEQIIAVRDRFGIKPLFIHLNQNDGLKIAFASEAKAFFASGILKPSLDPLALRDMLSFVPMDSIFNGVTVLPPATMMIVNLKHQSIETHTYWNLDLQPEPFNPAEHSQTNVVQALSKKLDEAVGLRLRADVPVGVYLSGGLDSAAIAATAARLSSQPLKVFSISFTDDPRFDEAITARKMAEKIGAEFHEVKCPEHELLNNLEDSLWYSETPAVNYNGVGKFLLSKLARQHVKCVLTGEGSDEAFLGYAYFQNPNEGLSSHAYGRHADSKGTMTNTEKEIIGTFGFVPQHEMIDLFSPKAQSFLSILFTKSQRALLNAHSPIERLSTRVNKPLTEKLELVNRLQTFSIKGLLSPFILSNLGDRQEMAHSLEGRTPFLDHHLFEWVCKLPNELKIKNTIEKYILRECIKSQVIEEVYEGRKWPYIAPPIWVQLGRSSAMDRLIKKYLSTTALKKGNLFSPITVRALLLGIRLKLLPQPLKEKFNNLLLYILTVQILEKQYVQDFSVSLDSKQ